jgi:hypothetical protein
MGISTVVLVWWMTLHRINAFLIPARHRSVHRADDRAQPTLFRRRRFVHALSSTLPVEDHTADVVIDRFMYDLYSSVAVLDPEWFQEYIVNLLGEEDEIVNDAFFQHVETVKLLPKAPPQPLHISPPTEYGEVLATMPSDIDLIVNDSYSSNSPVQITLETELMEPERSSVEEISEEAVPTVSTITSATSDRPINGTKAPIPEQENIPLSSITSDDLIDTTLILQSPVEVVSVKETEAHAPDDHSEVRPLNDVPSSSSPENVIDSVGSSPESRVVVYWNDEEEWKPVNLTTLLQLGYSEPEIVSLQSTALHCIVRDRIRKPRTGVPSRWKATESDMVHIIEPSLVPEIRRQRRASSGPSKSESSRISLASTSEVKVKSRDSHSIISDTTLRVDHVPTGTMPRSDSDGVDPSPRRRSRVESDTRTEVPRTESTERRRRSPETPKKERPIYSGRPAAAARRPDTRPPPPKSGVWPDIDTFRNLLRDEASFRLRILGSDWSNVVKDEMDWRNDLYTSWLWTLHHGIGEPFVQSRSDRARRHTRDRR